MLAFFLSYGIYFKTNFKVTGTGGSMKRHFFWGAVVLFVLISLPTFAQERIFTIQVASFPTLSEAKRVYSRLDALLPDAQKAFLRVERIGRFYVVRLGRFSSPPQARKVLKKVKREFPDAFVRRAYYIEQRIISLHRPEPVNKPEVKTEKRPPQSASQSPKPTPKASPQKSPPPEHKAQRGSNFLFVYGIALVLVFGVLVFVYMQRFRYLYFVKKVLPPSHSFLVNFTTSPRKEYEVLMEKLSEIYSLLEVNRTPLPYKTSPPEGYNLKNLWFAEKPEERFLKANNMVYLTTDATLPSQKVCPAIVLCRGKVTVQEGSTVRAVVSEKEINTGKNTRVLHFLDSKVETLLAEGTEVLESATTAGRLILNKDVFFRCLYGMPIITHGHKPKDPPEGHEDLKEFTPPKGHKSMKSNTTSIQSPGGSIDIPPRHKVSRHLIASQSVSIGSGALIMGNIKAGQSIEVFPDATIEGTLSANKEIVIKENVHFVGDSISAKDRIVIHHGVRIGTRQRPCIIRCDGEVVLSADVQIYGTIVTPKGYVI